ncbi:MAG: hypothetical protein Q9223_004259 [Gallowayella weberi]
MKDGYHLTKDRNDFTEEEKQNLLETQGTSYRDFLLHEGVVGTLHTEFLGNMVPNVHNDPNFIQCITQTLAKDTKMQSPRPDYAYGLDPKNSLARDEAGPDEDTFVFSATITTRSIDFWVHWYEGPSATQKYHMNRVGEVSLIKNFKNHHHYNEIRQKLHNIVQWGAIDRFSELRTLHERIGEYSREQRARR